MRQFTITPLIGLPTPRDPCGVRVYLALPAGEMPRQRRLLLLLRGGRVLDKSFIGRFAGFETIDLAPQTGLASIYAAGIQKERTIDLLVGLGSFVIACLYGCCL